MPRKVRARQDQCSWAAAATSTGKTGRRCRVRSSIRALRRRTAVRRVSSSGRMGQGTTQGPQRAGSSTKPSGSF